jgi:hypothetical protein
LSRGKFDPAFAAELSDDIFRYHDPDLAPVDQQDPQWNGGSLFGFEELVYQASFDVALAAVDRSGAQSEVLAREGIAERLLDPDLDVSSPDTARALGRLLDAPRRDLARNPNDSAAINAGVALVDATVTHEGHIAEYGEAAIAALYVDHTGAILNVGEDAEAWGANSPFARALADSDIPAGSAHWVITGALGANEAWQEKVISATGNYRAEVAAAGPGSSNPALWGQEIGQTDLEITQGIGRRGVLDGHEKDVRNGGIRWVVDKLTDYAGKIPYGQPFTGYAARGLNYVEDYGLDAILPIDSAQNERDGIPAELERQIVATQYTVLDGAIRSGLADDVPASLLADPNDPSKGLRVPTSQAEADALQKEVARYVESLPADDPTRQAIAGATNQLERAITDFNIAVLPE